MDNHISYEKAIEMLKLQDMKYHVLELNGQWKAIITQYGGRFLGPFCGDKGESVLWMNSAWKQKTAFRRFITNHEWNMGGERLWINPELRFFVKAPEKFSETYTVQPALDPGNYEIAQTARGITLCQDISLTDLNTDEIHEISAKRSYQPAENPLKYVRGANDIQVDYCGYIQKIEMECNDFGEITIEPWTVTQVNPEGRFIIPYFGEFDCVDYYGNNPEDVQTVHDGYAELDANGALKYKFGYRSAQTFGRMAYLKPHGDGWQLMIRNYYNDPSMPYCAEPFGELGNRGCSMYFYNDRGGKGGFAEFENSGTPIDSNSENGKTVSISSTWFFFGDQENIGKVITNLMGIHYDFDRNSEVIETVSIDASASNHLHLSFHISF